MASLAVLLRALATIAERGSTPQHSAGVKPSTSGSARSVRPAGAAGATAATRLPASRGSLPEPIRPAWPAAANARVESPSVTAAALLREPRSLAAAFVIAEVLAPPRALRER